MANAGSRGPATSNGAPGAERKLLILLVALVGLAVLALIAVLVLLVVRPPMPGTGQTVAAAVTAAPPTDAPTQPPTSVPATATPVVVVVEKVVEKVVTATPLPTATLAPSTETPIPPTETPTVEPTATAEPSATPAPPTPTNTATTTPTAAAAARLMAAGQIFDFNTLGTWQRGDQTYGTLETSSSLAHEGTAAAKLSYDFPAVQDNFVVFRPMPPIPIAGEAKALSMWVYGDGSGHFLNAWLEDSKGQVRQFTFGRLLHRDAWQPMTARIDTTLPWPQAHISGQDSVTLTYPVRLYALVLDAKGTTTASRGAIYVDQLAAADIAGTATPVASGTPAPTSQPAASLAGRIVFTQANNGRVDVMAVDVASKNTWTVATNAVQPRLRADGRVLFNGIGGGRNNLSTIGIDGSGERITGQHPEDAYPDWSPDTQSGVFYSTFGRNHYEQIYVQRDLGQREDPVELQIGGFPVLGRFPTWLESGRIAYSGCDYWGTGSNCGIWTVNSDGSGQPARLTEIMDDRSTDSAPGSLLFSSSKTGNWDVYLVPESGGTPKNLTKNASQDFGATFSPDGRSIAFGSDRDGGWGIWVMGVDGRDPRKLIDVPGGFGPNWADDRLSWGP